MARRYRTKHPNIQQHFEESDATIKGHLRQQRQGTESTKPNQTETEEDDTQPQQEANNEKTHAVYATTITLPYGDATGKIFSDQTGRFPVISSQGNQYVLVVYDYDSNSILAKPIKNRTGKGILRVFKTIIKTLKQCGFKPQLHKLDNEASTALKTYLKTEEIHFQLVPPHKHRQNAAERAIQTFKAHFITGNAPVGSPVTTSKNANKHVEAIANKSKNLGLHTRERRI